jgi:predicted metal-dependent hydrolase
MKLKSMKISTFKNIISTGKTGDIEFKVTYSGRRSIGISVLPDASVVVRVPRRTSIKTITRIVREKSAWIIKHRDNYRNCMNFKSDRSYSDASAHLYRGKELILNIEKSRRTYVIFRECSIEMGLEMNENEQSVKKLLYKGYKEEAVRHLPVIFNRILEKLADQMFKPTALVVRTMRRRWGSCSNRGKITLSTELIKLDNIYIEYVIIHELCHLKQHNHGPKYYDLLSELFPEWKRVRKEMRGFVR